MTIIVNLLETFFDLYLICIFIWALISWLPMVSPQLAYNETVGTIRRFLDSVVLPYVRLFRFVPPVRVGGAMIDLSALVAILVLSIGGSILINILKDSFGIPS